MGGYGSGRSTGRPTVESALRLDIDWLKRMGAIVPGARTVSELRMQFYDDEIFVPCDAQVGDRWDSWLRLQYRIFDYWTGEPHDIDEKIYLAASERHFGGLRWWFVCPRENRRVRKLCLPLGARHFRSRGFYRLVYCSQREAVHDRAQRRARKLIHRLGGHWNDDQYPNKPPRMRWRTYNLIMDKIVAADRLADERIFALAARWSA